MPQMAPMNWILLFAYFSLIFIMFNVTNYFSFLYKEKQKKESKKKLTFNWKW